METEDLSDIPSSCNSGLESMNDDLRNSICEPNGGGSETSNSESKLNGDISGTVEVDGGNGGSQTFLPADVDGDLISSSSVLEAHVELNEIVVTEDAKCFNTELQTENGSVAVQDGSPSSNRKRGGSPISNHEIDDVSISGVKKARRTIDEQQSSVHVTYNCLQSDSKQKLEELLQKWSDWHAQNCSTLDSTEVLESGEETYFPAIRIGLDNLSSVSFWMDTQTRNQKSMEFIALDSKSVPLYDRGYSLEGGLEIVDASRCFNCGSYGHALKECTKPRDTKAVSSARKQHNSKRNHNPSSRNPTRYYQDSPRGKYDGLRPGVLDAETRKLLGLGELDPPPWLTRMQEMGYPPGYLDAEYDDEPSGITIFSDEQTKEGKQPKEDGEILETSNPPKKMSVGFPGINAPIPKNADEKRWTAGSSSSSHYSSWNHRSHHRNNHSSEEAMSSRDQYHEQRRSRDFRDVGPPGCDTVFNSSYHLRYGGGGGGYDSSSQSPRYSRGNIPIPSPSFGSDRGRWSPLGYEGSSNPGSHTSVLYSPPNTLFSPPSYGAVSGYARRGNGSSRNDDFHSDFSSNSKDRHHPHSWR